MLILVVQSIKNGPFEEAGRSVSEKILNAYFRIMGRPPRGFTGAKMLKENGTVHRVIF